MPKSNPKVPPAAVFKTFSPDNQTQLRGLVQEVALFSSGVCFILREGVPALRPYLPNGLAAPSVRFAWWAWSRLAYWESTGAAEYLPDDLPTATGMLGAICFPDQASAEGLRAGDITRRVLEIRLSGIVPMRIGDQHHELVVAGDPDAMLDQIAQLLWKHRHLGCAA